MEVYHAEREELLAKDSGTEDEVLDAAVQHAVSPHGHQKSPEWREQIKSILKDENE